MVKGNSMEQEVVQLRAQVAALEQLLETHEQVVFQQSDRLEQALGSLTKRATEFEIVAQVSVAASTILEVEKLLQTVVDLTKTGFGLYHVHIYLLNEAGDALNLAAGAGEVGQQMMVQGWRIPIRQEHSLVVRAARTQQSVIINDVQSDPDFLPNPLLPETRAEMAVPMIVGNKVIGVFDLQANVIDGFTQEDAHIQTILAGQIVVALQNARLYAETAQRAVELETLSQISRRLSAVLDPKQLIAEVVEQVGATFNYYHTQIYLFDEARENIVLAGATGEVGRVMLERQHSLPVGRGLVGRAAERNIGMLVPDVFRSIGVEIVTQANVEQVYQREIDPAIEAQWYANYITQYFSDVKALAKELAGQESAREQIIQLGYVLHVLNVFTQTIRRGAEAAAQDLQVSLEITGPVRLGEHRPLFEALVQQGKDGLVTVPNFDLEGWTVTIRQATDAGIPIVAANNQHAAASLNVYQSGFQSGVILIREVIKLLIAEERTEGLIIVGPSPLDRYAGIMYPLGQTDYTVIHIDRPESGDVDEVRAYWEEAISHHPDLIAAVGLTSMDIPVLARLKRDSGGQWLIAGYDLNIETLEAIQAGLAQVTIGQHPYLQGYLPILALVEHLRLGKSLEGWMAEGWLPNPLLPETRAEVVVPIALGERVLGVLDVQHNMADSLKPENTSLLRSIADQVAVALQNARLYAEAAQRTAELETLSQISRRLSVVLDPKQLITEVVEQVGVTFNYYHTQIYLFDEPRENMVLAGGTGEPGRLMLARQHSLPKGRGLVGRAAEQNKIVLAPDVRRHIGVEIITWANLGGIYQREVDPAFEAEWYARYIAQYFGDVKALVDRLAAHPDRTGKALKLGYVLHGPGVFPDMIQRGAEAAARDLQVEVELVSPVHGGEHLPLFEAMVRQGKDGLVVVPDQPSWVQPIQRALEAGIPVVTANRDLRFSPALTHVAQDNFQSGLMLVGELVKLLIAAGKHKGKILMSAGVADRNAGVRHGLRNTDYTLIEIEGFIEEDLAVLRTYWEQAINRQPDLIAAMGLTSPETPILAEIKRRMGGQWLIVGYDLEPATLEAVRDGNVKVTIGQHPYLQGYLPILALVEHLRLGKSLEGWMAEGWLPNPLLPETRAEVVVPIALGERVLGVLDVQHNNAGSLKQENANLLRSVADQVAVALQNARLYAEAAQRTAELETLSQISRRLSAVLDPKQLIAEVVEQVGAVFNYYYTQIYLFDQARENLVLASGTGEPGRLLLARQHSLPKGRGLVGRAAEQNKIVLAPDVRRHIGVEIVTQSNVAQVYQRETDQSFEAQWYADWLAKFFSEAKTAKQLVQQPAAIDKVIKIGYALNVLADFTAVMQRGAETAAQDLGVELDIAGSTRVSEHFSLFETWVSEGKDGLVTVPDTEAWAATIQEALKASIPVVASNIESPLPGILNIVQDNFQSGAILAREVTHLLLVEGRKQGKIILSPSNSDRIDGFVHGMRDTNYTIIHDGRKSGVTQADLLAYWQKTIGEHPDLIAAVGLGSWDIPLLAELKRNSGAEWLIAGYDLDFETLEAIQDRVAQITIGQHPYLQGYLPILALVEHLRQGKSLEGWFAEGWLPNSLLPETKAEVAVPIALGERVLGVLDVQHNIAGSLKQEHANLLRSVADQIAVALENARLFEQTQMTLAETENLYNAGRRISAASDLQELVAAVAEEAPVRVINRVVLHIFEYNSAGEMEAMVLLANWHSGVGTSPLPLGTRYPRATFTTIGLFHNPEPLFFDDIQHDERIEDSATLAVLQQQHIRAMAVLPLWVGTRQLGVLLLQTEEMHHFAENEIRPYLSLVGPMAVSIENKRLLEQAQARAHREQILREVMTQVHTAADVDTIMRTTVREVGRALGRPAFVYLDNTEKQSAHETNGSEVQGTVQ